MLVGIHYNLRSNQFGFESQKFIELLEYNRINTLFLYAGDRSFWDRVKDCDLFIFQWGHHDYYRQIARSILPVIEHQLKIRCFPNCISSWLYDDKVREYYCLKAINLPITESWIFYDEKKAMAFAREAEYPLVFKLRCGAGAKSVLLLNTKEQAVRFIKIMFRKGLRYNKLLPGNFIKSLKEEGIQHFIRKRLGNLKSKLISGDLFFDIDWLTHRNYILFQKFLPNNQYDTRVVVIGRNALAFRRFNRPNDFRASGSKSYSLDPNQIDPQFIEIAIGTSQKMGFDSMAYDFLYDENKKPSIAEISYVFGATQGSKANLCPGYWDDKLKFHNDKPGVALLTLRHLLKASELKSLK